MSTPGDEGTVTGAQGADGTAPALRWQERFLLVSNPGFRWYWVAGSSSAIGTWLHNIVGAILILTLSGQSVLVGVLSFAYFSPMLFLSMAGGVAADRYGSVRVIVCSNLAACLVASSLAVILEVGTSSASVVALLAASVLLGVANAITKPAFSALLPGLVERSETSRASALATMQFHIGQMIGGLMAAFCLTHEAYGLAFGLNALTFVFPVVFVLWLRRRRGGELARPPVKARGRGYLVQAFRFSVSERSIIVALVCMVLATAVLEGVRVVVPILAVRGVTFVESDAALLITFMSAGSTCGLLMFGFLSRRVPLRRLLSMGFLGQCVGVVGLAAFSLTWPGFAFAVLIGLSFAVSMPNLTAVLFLRSPEAMRGRVMALQSMALGLRPFSSLVVAGLSSVVVEPRWVLLLFIGTLCLLGFGAVQRVSWSRSGDE